MPRRAKGARLYLDPKRKHWIIRDGGAFVRTGCGKRDSVQAEKCLAQYIQHKYKPIPSEAPCIADVLNIYGQEVAPYRRTARNIGNIITNLLKWWGTKNVAEISARTCREYAATKANSTAAQDIKILRAAVGYWHKEYGPLRFMPAFWRPQESGPRERWLTRTEAARLLSAAKPYKHIRRLVLLCLYTGSRPGVIQAMQWKQIDFASGIMVRTLSPQTKNKKAPAVKLGRRILAHLKRWKKVDGNEKFICGGFKDPHTTWGRVVKASGLKGITRHTLRHTRATWLMQAGVPTWEAAGHLGMTTRTLEQVYGKHSPDFQERAANV